VFVIKWRPIVSYNSLIPNFIKKTLQPFRNLEKSFNNLWSETPTISYVDDGGLLPNISVSENNEEFHISAQMPGLGEKDVYVELEDGKLTLRGAREAEKEVKHTHYRIAEHSRVYFNHSVQLPSGIDENSIEATMNNGVIDITLAKTKGTQPAKKPRKANPKSK